MQVRVHAFPASSVEGHLHSRDWALYFLDAESNRWLLRYPVKRADVYAQARVLGGKAVLHATWGLARAAVGVGQ